MLSTSFSPTRNVSRFIYIGNCVIEEPAHGQPSCARGHPGGLRRRDGGAVPRPLKRQHPSRVRGAALPAPRGDAKDAEPGHWPIRRDWSHAELAGYAKAAARRLFSCISCVSWFWSHAELAGYAKAPARCLFSCISCVSWFLLPRVGPGLCLRAVASATMAA